jgi:glutathione S-transferase
MPLEQYAGDTKQAVMALRGALEPVRPVLVQHQFVGGHGPGYCDYVLFGAFQWARSVSPTRLLEPDDPVYAWRERMLDLFDGFARKAKGYEVWV